MIRHTQQGIIQGTSTYHRKVAADTAKTAKDKVEKDMNLFAVDQLGPTQKALEEAEENEKGVKQQ